MDLENLKQVWDKEKIETTPKISLEKQKEIHTPLEMIRMNMRSEFWMNIIFLPFLFGLIPFMTNKMEQRYFLAILVFLIFGITGYYYLKFYTFYKKLNTKNLNTYHNILDLRYELVLNSELYKSFYIVFIPIWLCFYAIFMYDEETNFTFFTIRLLIFCVILYFTGKYWLYEKYGKYIKKISNIVAEMTEEEDGFEYDRSFLKIKKEFVFIEKTKNFCNNKFGKYGPLVFIMFILILMLLISFFAGVCLGILHLILSN